MSADRDALGAELEQLREQNTRLADGLWAWRDDAEKYRDERDRLVAGIEALADEWERTSPAWIDPVAGPVHELRALLPTREQEGDR